MPIVKCSQCGQAVATDHASAFRCPTCDTAVSAGPPEIGPYTRERREVDESPELHLETDEDAAMRLMQDRKWAFDVMREEKRAWRRWYLMLGSVALVIFAFAVLGVPTSSGDFVPGPPGMALLAGGAAGFFFYRAYSRR